ncbi:MAG TPA: tripartite tricarboxylate transporter TctB family protein [Aurantimonas sp.]|jgi:hypothetical protein|nr:tripartite tricarboxylate transporter TctB family protein [Aurantimonas sp.]
MRFAFCALLIVLAGALVWQAAQIGGSPGVYPLVVTSGALLFSLSYTLQRAVRGWDQRLSQTPFSVPPQAALRVGVFVAVWLAYVVLLPYGGFIVTTAVALLASLAVVRGRVTLLDAAATALFVLVLAILMKIVLYVPVPQGWLDQSLETLLYRLR